MAMKTVMYTYLVRKFEDLVEVLIESNHGRDYVLRSPKLRALLIVTK